MTSTPTTLHQIRVANGDSQRRLLITGGVVITMDPEVGDFLRGDILVVGSRIAAIGADLNAAGSNSQTLRIDATDCVIVPGFVDGHRHLWQTQVRRLLPDLQDPERYLSVMIEGLSPQYQPDDIYLGTLLGCLGCLDAGITTVLDFCHNARSAAHSDSAIQALHTAGIRAVHASCAPWAGDWDHQWPHDLARLQDDIDADVGGLVTLRMGLGGSPSLGPIVALSADRLRRARDLGIAVTVDGVIGPACSAVVAELGEAGLLGPDITLIHCIDLNDAAWRSIAATGTKVVLAPTSDAMIGMGGGVFPIDTTIERSIRPGLSVDVEVTLAHDMFSQMRAVLEIQRMFVHNDRYRRGETRALLDVRSVLGMATVGGADASGVLAETGTLTVGKQADLLLVGAEDINTLPLNNAIGTVVSGADCRNVHAVFVGGVARKWDGSLVDVDISALRSAVHTSRDGILERSGYPLGIVA